MANYRIDKNLEEKRFIVTSSQCIRHTTDTYDKCVDFIANNLHGVGYIMELHSIVTPTVIVEKMKGV